MCDEVYFQCNVKIALNLIIHNNIQRVFVFFNKFGFNPQKNCLILTF